MEAEGQRYIESAEVTAARGDDKPIVALESTILTQGMTYPQNVEIARLIAQTVRDNGATPAIIALMAGNLHIGLEESELESLGQAAAGSVKRVSRANFPVILASGMYGATTIAGTMIGAHIGNVELVATGAIGGVHVGNPFDISADLTELAQTPVTVVCSGMKPFLDLANTREVLETNGVTVVGLKNDDAAPFFTQHSGLDVDLNADSHKDVGRVVQQRHRYGLQQATMVINPVPDEYRTDMLTFVSAVERLVIQAKSEGIVGRAITNWMVRQLAGEIGPAVFKANVDLLCRNAAAAAQLGLVMAH